MIRQRVAQLLAELRGDVVCAELLDWRVEPATELIAERPRQPHRLSGVRLADAYTCALRGYEAVHCASAEQLNDGDLAMATGDWKLRDACMSLGMATADVFASG